MENAIDDVTPQAGTRTTRWLFVAAILAGSFLLFLVQPMVARMALPQLGAASWGLMERLGMRRRADLDFRLRGYSAEDPVGAMIVYMLERPR